MNRFFSNLAPVRNWRWSRAARAFIQANAEQGVLIRDQDVPRAIASVKTLVLDETMLMQGRNSVRMIAAPLSLCELDKFRRQGSWMMLAAGVSLGCEDYAPLERFARELNFERERMVRQYPQVEALPYDERRRIETTIHRDAGGLRAYTKGEPEAILSRCTQLLDGRERPLDEDDLQQALSSMRLMEDMGLLTLGFATSWLEAPGAHEENMVFLGVVGMGDLPRPEAPAAFDTLRDMGIRPVLISEHTLMDGAARSSGLLPPDAYILHSDSLHSLKGEALREAVRETGAFLEISEPTRGRILRALRAEGPVATLTQTKEGSIALSLDRGAVGEALLPSGGLPAVAALIQSCQTLINDHKPR